MMNIDWTVIITAFLGGGLLTAVFNYFSTKRNVDRSSLVNDTAKIQEVYEKTLDDMTNRHDKERLEKDKKILELQEEIRIRNARLDEARQRQGEMLVAMEGMKDKLSKVDDNVNKITGDFGKFPLVNDRQSEPYGRRAMDKPKGE